MSSSIKIENKRVAYIHPKKFVSLSEQEKQLIQNHAEEIKVLSNDELEALAGMLGINNDNHFWNPDNIYLVYENT